MKKKMKIVKLKSYRLEFFFISIARLCSQCGQKLILFMSFEIKVTVASRRMVIFVAM